MMKWVMVVFILTYTKPSVVILDGYTTYDNCFGKIFEVVSKTYDLGSNAKAFCIEVK